MGEHADGSGEATAQGTFAQARMERQEHAAKDFPSKGVRVQTGQWCKDGFLHVSKGDVLHVERPWADEAEPQGHVDLSVLDVQVQGDG